MSTTTTNGNMQSASAAIGGLKEIDAATLKRWLDADEAVVVDVREVDEHARERIPGAQLASLSKLDPTQVPASSEARRVVLHCRSGRRSGEAAGRLLASGHVEAFHLKGGLEAWKAAGLPIQENPRLPISIIRQVQLVIGAVVLAGSILAATVSPWFLLLTGFFGVGVFIAGATGTCGMAAVVGHMPWNRAFRAAGDPCVRGICR
ncbi:MAG: rhodanese family protein [Phycisphaerales bacterium]|nr:rhodanese family protein [Phycisphaerales bacterium]